MKKIIFTLVVAACALIKAQAQVQPGARHEAESEAVAFAQTLAPGWNLGNSLDCHADGVAAEDCWKNDVATIKAFKTAKAAGFKAVRIPVTWMGHIGAAPIKQLKQSHSYQSQHRLEEKE